MKSIFALALLGLVAVATPSFAQDNSKVLGNYVVTGTETDGAKYDGEGTLAVTMDKSGALELKWDGGKYVGIGQVEGSKLFVGSLADGKVVIMVMDIKPDGSLEGKWWRRTDAGTKGTEVWKKK
ncbi:MAG TPA: hypothetical protein VNR39_06745 [Pseudolabrys sp.]|nr:hypothetical protein [Pseudolabrys sp.]